MRILDIEQIRSDGVSNKGSRVHVWKVSYEHDGLHVPALRKTFKFMCGLTAEGKFFLTSAAKDADKVLPALRSHELFRRMRITIAAEYLTSLVKELGDDAVKQAFEEAVVKSVDEA